MREVVLAAMLGDGIGPDIVTAMMNVMRVAGRRSSIEIAFDVLPCGLSALETHGSTLPLETVGELKEYPGWVLGPISQHLYPTGDSRYVNPSGHLRKHFDLYANIRPARSFTGVRCVRDDVDLVIVRENTEG